MSFFFHSSLLRGLPLLAVLLTACAHHPLPENTTNDHSAQWQARQASLKKLTRFQSRGAFAYVDPDHRVYARYNWQQQAPDQFRLILTNPLGGTEMQLDQQGQTVQVVDSQGHRSSSHHAQQLLSDLSGMQIPLDILRQWMVGLPGKASHFTLDNEHQLRHAEYQEGGQQWYLTITDYTSTKPVSLPASLELKAGKQRIKLRLDDWVLK